MKKIKLLVVVVLIIMIFVAQATVSVFAKTDVDPMDALVPQDTLVLAKFNLENVSDSIQSVVDLLISSIQPQDAAVATVLQDLFDDQVAIGVAINDIEEGIFMITTVTDEEYTEVETVITADVSLETSTYFSRFGDYLVIADSEWMLQSITDTVSAGIGISGSDYYNEVRQVFPDDGFFELYVAPTADLYQSFGLSVEGEVTMIDAVKAFGFSLGSTDDGLNLKSYTVTDNDVLAELGIDYAESIGTPDLYNYMPSEFPIFYAGGFNLRQSWDMLMSNVEFASYESEIETGFQDSIGVDFNDGFMSLLEGESAFLIQDSGEFLPSSTIMIDVDGQENKAEIFLNGLTSYVWEIMNTIAGVTIINDITISFSDEASTITITKTEEDMLGGNFTVFNVEIEQEESENPYQMFLPSYALDYKISIGVTSDGVMMFSTNKNIKNDYGQGISEFDLSDKLLSAVSYFSMDNIGSYVDRIIDDIVDSNEDMDTSSFQEAKDAMDDFFGIFHDMYSETVSTNDYSSQDIAISIDVDTISDLWIEFLNATAGAAEGFETYSNSQTTFEDVAAGEWYSDDVYYLKTEGVVTGYEDGTFAPSSEITRAEFTVLLVRALQEKGYLEESFYYYDEDVFEDVSSYEWYSADLYTAKENGIISGHEDGSFKPNDFISRAEAVKIIANAFDIVSISEHANYYATADFPDVPTDAWYYNPVIEVQILGIVEGTDAGIFEPTRSINRAESAKIISKFMTVVEDQGL
ncbi:MAG: YvnB [uncultured bacterium]|nr:MAG: YvnB [uncultured bacterium]OGJ47934.1 MAG: hypothetical protein A2344_04100 [Candidatus Peregrinibacteria bacterium RIFOXYB12_FULL_41_12]OGJ48522.1 MAG: hypothetical protein A2244_05880 [Candidatus Peregrinibacteria bacterium RIFOXYA2_FULL_41_18]OGJ52764.1 MAG: hypothetical protein A2448_02625 [Candidatus Peregrinibacteria bacterium RIFOXYC2_FULL_41_22]